MNIKVNNQYLDFNGQIDIERQVKLFEEAATTNGDFSYSFTIKATDKNRAIFQLFSINQSGKIIYTKIPAVIENFGTPIYFGFIKVENDNEKEIDVSFFSGNSNWMNELNFNLRDFDFSSLDEDWDIATIDALDSATEGIIYPVINTGAMDERSYVNWHRDDFHPFVYVKTIIQTLFSRSGIKLTGDILQDWRYNYLITSNSGIASPPEELNSRETFVNKSSGQFITAGASAAIVTFNNTTGNYYPGDLWNTGTSRFTADKPMIVTVEITAEIDTAFADFATISLFVNGTELSQYQLDYESSIPILTKSATFRGVQLASGDILDIRCYAEDPGVPMPGANINSATAKITPTRIYSAITTLLLPDTAAKDFIANVFGLFNPVINYNGLTKVLNVDLFKNVIRKEEIDISEYVNASTVKNDYSELMENYGILNLLTYSDAGTDTSDNYNTGNRLQFGSGEIESNNELAQDSVPIFESDFLAAMEDTKNPFKTFLPKLAWRSISTNQSTDAAATSSGGLLFTYTPFTDGSVISVGDLIKIESDDPSFIGYNGQWIVSATPSSTTFRVMGLAYIQNNTVNITKLTIEFDSSDEQALLLAIPAYTLSKFTNNTLLFLAEPGFTDSTATPATAYFYKPLQGLDVDSYKESLSFGPVNIPNDHQITMIDSYWLDFKRILQDPVKVLAEANFPLSVFNRLFDGPLRLKTKKFNARFFMNKVVGYSSKSSPADIELIKLNP